LFERKVSARRFATTDVDVFDETVDGSILKKYKEDTVAAHSEQMEATESKAFEG